MSKFTDWCAARGYDPKGEFVVKGHCLLLEGDKVSLRLDDGSQHPLSYNHSMGENQFISLECLKQIVVGFDIQSVAPEGYEVVGYDFPKKGQWYLSAMSEEPYKVTSDSLWAKHLILKPTISDQKQNLAAMKQQVGEIE